MVTENCLGHILVRGFGTVRGKPQTTHLNQPWLIADKKSKNDKLQPPHSLCSSRGLMVEVVGSDSVRGGAGETAAYAAAGGDSPVASAPQDNDSCKLSAGNGDAGDRLLPPAQPSPAKPHSGHPPAAHTPSVASDYGGRPGGTLASLRHVSRAFKRTREEADLHAMGAFHSSDYDGLESRLERTALAKTSDWDFDLLHIWRWLLPIIIGIVVGMWTSLFFFTLKKLTDWRFDVTSRYIAPGSGFWRPFGVFLGFSILYSTIAGFLGSILTPASAGGGYAEVLSYLAGVRIQGLLTLPTLVSKLIGLVATIASGIVSGRGGPFVQMGAAIGGGIAGFGSQTISRWSRGWLGSNAWLRSNVGALLTHTAAAHRDFVTVGGAAGLSAAFTAPIAGVLFAVEDGAAFYSVRLLWQSLLASSVSSYVTSFLLEMRDVGGSIWTVQASAGCCSTSLFFLSPPFLLSPCARCVWPARWCTHRFVSSQLQRRCGLPSTCSSPAGMPTAAGVHGGATLCPEDDA